MAETGHGTQVQVAAARPVFGRKVMAPGHEILAYGHAVLGQGTRLVGEDERGAAQRLNRRQVAHQRVAPGHALGGQRQRERHRGQETFRHIGHDDADGEHEVGPERQSDAHPDEEKQDAETEGQQGHQPRDPADFLLQRRFGFAGGLGQVRDAPEFGVHSRGENDGAALPGNDQRTRKEQPGGSQGVAPRRCALGAARLGSRLAGERGHVHAYAPALQDAAIGGHLGPFGEQHDVARHQPFGFDFQALSGAPDAHPLRQHQAQGGKRLLGPVRLPERETAVDQNDPDNGQAQGGHALPRLIVLGDKSKPGGQPEDEGKEVAKLAQQGQPQGRLDRGLDPVRPELLQAVPHLGRGKPLPPAAEHVQHGFGRMQGDIQVGRMHTISPPPDTSTPSG